MKLEKIEFDELERVSLKKEVFLKLPLLRKYVYNEEYFTMLIAYLDDIHQQPMERIIDAISYVNNDLVDHYGQRITSEREPLYYSSLLWEWIYLLAYYLHQLDDDPQWHENFLPHMKQFQIRPAAISEMDKGEKLIDQYIDKRYRVMETQQRLDNHTADTNSQQTTFREAQYLARIAELEARIKELEEKLEQYEGSSTTGPTEKQLEETFTYPFRQSQGYPLMIDHLIKDAKAASDIQWARHALAIYDNVPSVLLNKPTDFKSWLIDFCKLFHREWVRDYEPQKLRKVKGKRAKPSKIASFLPCR